MKEKNLILVGGGGHCKSVIEVAESAGYSIKGILDTPENVGKKVLSYRIIGTDDQIAEYVNECVFIVTVGQIKNADLRIKLHGLIKDAGGKIATIIANTAYVSKYSSIGEGTIIMHKAFVNADVKIGKGCIINTCANVGHEVEVGDYCHISTGVMLSGNCRIGNNTFIGSNSVLTHNCEIISGCVIGAGSVIVKNINVRGTYVGNPANKIK